MNVYERLKMNSRSFKRLTVKYYPDRELSLNFAEIFKYTQNIMIWFQLHGLKKGSRMALLMGNNPEFMLLTFAAAASGIITIPINTYASQNELETIVKDSTPDIFFYDSTNPFVNKAVAESQIFVTIKCLDIWDNKTPMKGCLGLFDMQLGNILESDDALQALSIQSLPEDVLAILYTSGSTGICKAIPKTYESFSILISSFIEKTMYIFTKLGILSMLQLCPHFHNTGFTSLMLSLYGMPFCEVTFDHFNAPHIVERLDAITCKIMLGTPTMFTLMARAMGQDKYKGNVMAIITTGATADHTFTNLVESSLRPQIIYSGYGTTECGAVAQRLAETQFIKIRLKILLRVAQKLNILVPSVSEENVKNETGATLLGIVNHSIYLKIFDIFTGKELSEGNVGEICIKVPTSSVKNYDQSDIYKEEFILTGDLGYRKGDMLYLTGRSKNIINRGGEKISSYEVEQILIQHEDIQDVIVIPFSNSIYGEEVCACIIKKNDSLCAKTISNFLEMRLSKYKWPTQVHFFEQFPLTGSGKIDVIKIKEMIINIED